MNDDPKSQQEDLAATRILDLSRSDPAWLRELERFRRPIAVLFADVVGSTSYFEQYGDIAGMAMVHRFNHLVSHAVEEHGGRVIKKIGDGIMTTFEETAQCVQSAIEIQRRLQQLNVKHEDTHRIAVRIGLHHGIGIVRSDNDVFGDVVNVAARIQSLAQPGQVLVSDVVREELSGSEYKFRLVGVFRLQGKSEERDLFEVFWGENSAPDESIRSFRLCHLNADPSVDADDLPLRHGVTIGQHDADINFPDLAIDSPHARFLIERDQLAIEDLSETDGVFVQLMEAHVLQPNDTIMVGSRRFRFTRNTEGTAELILLDEEGVSHQDRYSLAGSELRIGRSLGDLVFPHDRFMSRAHAQFYRQSAEYLVEDLCSRNGTFIKVRGKARIPTGARIWIGGDYFQIKETAE